MARRISKSELYNRQLVDSVLAGDAAATSVLFRRCHERVFCLALGALGNRDDAREVAQEAFLKIYRHLGSYPREHGASFRVWVYRIVINLVIDYNRQAYRKREVLVSQVTDDTAVALGSHAALSAECRKNTPEKRMNGDFPGWGYIREIPYQTVVVVRFRSTDRGDVSRFKCGAPVLRRVLRMNVNGYAIRSTRCWNHK